MEKQKVKYFGVSSWAIDNKMTTFVIMAIIIIGGLMAYTSLPRESFPEIVESKIYISSFYPGNSAEDVEKLVTKPLEDQANDISGVTKITSTTVQGYASIQVEFSEDISPEQAKVKVKDKVDAVKSQPDWPTLDNGSKVAPNVFDLNISELTPITNINITGDFSSMQLKAYAEAIQDKIEDLPEVKEAQILGVQEKEIEVAVDLYKMTASDLSLNSIIGAIQKENLTISGGNIIQNGMRRNVRVLGEIENPEELKNIVVKNDGGVVLLGDVAEIKFREKDRTTFAREYGNPVVMLSVMKKSGENMIEAVNKIKKLLEEAKTTFLPPALNVTITNDQSTRTEAQVSELENSIIFGVLLVVSVLMFFLGFRNAVFVGIAIPLSIMMSFLLLPVLGNFMGMNITLNTMVLFATVMGLGMLVDNGIVVVENVYRLMDQGVPRLEAAKQGVGEIAWPIIASTATTLAAFLPLGMWPGIMGKFMIYFPLTLATVLGSSLFIALIINAMLTSVFMKTEEAKMSTKQLIIISCSLLGFGILLIISGLSESTSILLGLGALIFLLGAVQSFIGWKNRAKTKLLKRGLGIAAAGFIFLLLGIFGILGSLGLSGFTAFSKTLLGFGNLFVVLATLLWIHKYVLLNLSNKFQNKLLPALENKYKKFLAFALRGSNAYTFAFGTFGLLLVSFIVFWVSQPNILFFPNNEPNQAIVYIEYPEGTDIVKTNAITKEIESDVRDELAKYSYEKAGSTYNFMAETIIAQVGEGAGNPQTDGGSQNELPHKGKVTVMFREFKYRKDQSGTAYSSNQVLSDLRARVQGYPGVSIIVDKDQNGPPAGYAINMEIAGEDYGALLAEAEKIKSYLGKANIPGVEGLKINVNQNKPEMEVYVDRKKAGSLGLSTQMVGGALRQAIYGIDASTYKEGDDDYDIVVRFDADSRYNENALFNQSITFRNNKGKLLKIPIGSVVSKRNVAAFSSIKRKDLKRVITVYSNALEGYNATKIVEQMTALMKNYPLPKDILYNFTGEQEEQAKNLAFLSKALLIAVALILLIIVAQFNSISKPIIILIAIVLSFIGVLFGIVGFGDDFVVIMTMMGIISLAGIVVNNAIVLMDYTQLLIDRKKESLGLKESELLTRADYMDAIVEGGKARLRPVLLTAITTILGLIPLAIGFNLDFFGLFTEFNPNIYFGGDNTIFWEPMSWTIIYGLTFATFLTLVIVPVLFYLLNRAKIRFAAD
jgi:multidrug efflux pump subunit AcrB